MNLDSEYCVAEYSYSQNKFHCDYLKESLKNNRNAVLKNEPSDWILLGIFKTWNEAQEFIEKTKKRINYPNNK